MTEQYIMKKSINIPSVKGNKVVWYHLEQPTPEDMEFLQGKFRFHPLDLEDCLSKKQRPKIDIYKDYMFLVVQLPERHSKLHFIKVSEVNIFIGKDYIVTVNHKNRSLKELFEIIQKDARLKQKMLRRTSSYFLYELIKYLFNATYPSLDRLGEQITRLEKQVFSPELEQQDQLREILVLKKDIINFRRIIIPQRRVLAELSTTNSQLVPKQLAVYFDDVVDLIEKMWGNLENYRDLIDSLQETNEALISHNTNNIIKILTIFSVIMLPLTFITGLYGMNLQTLPFVHHPESFMIVIGMMAAVALGMLAYFNWKKWL